LLALGSWRDSASDLSAREVAEGVITSAAKGAGAGLVAAALVLAIAWWLLLLARSARARLEPHA
ncbi:MAG: hypothetical protein GX678_03455, partial [Actinomycetales bacterium]|nr:hypothetical protein [Actinomycetales bacterium]